MPVARQGTVAFSHHTIIERDTLAYIYNHMALFETETILWEDAACTPEYDRDNIASQLLSQMEGTTAEGMYLRIIRASTLREDKHRIATLHDVLHVCQHLIHRHGAWEEVAELDNLSIQLALPHPLASHYYHLWVKHKRQRQVYERLMIGNDQRWLVEILAMGITHLVSGTAKIMAYETTEEMCGVLVVLVLILCQVLL